MMLLELTRVAKVYGAATKPLEVPHGIDLDVDHGEFVAITGPSGSGKSTLLHIVGCLDRPSSGTYRIDGEDTAGLDDDALSQLRKTRIGFVFQSFHLVTHLSVAQNIELPMFYARKPRRERQRRANELAERVGLGHRVDHVPTELSGGECQRAAVARALALDPPLVLADEPTGNLDSQMSKEIMALLDELNRAGRTIVMITHDRDVAAMGSRQVAFRDGRIESDRRREVVI